MRLVLDTNTVVSGLIWPSGAPGRLIDLAQERKIEIATSPALLAELFDVIHRRKFTKPLAKRELIADDLCDGYATLAQLVTPADIPRICRDPDDDHVIACAIGAQASLIVTGDSDLLTIGRWGEIRILASMEAVEVVEASR